MKTKILTLTFGLLSLSTLFAQTLQTREIKPFNKIQASGGAKIYYTHSDSLTLSVKGNEDEISFVETRLEDNTLYISAKGNYKETMRIYVTNNTLQDVSLSGAVSFESKNTIKAEELHLSLTGAANGNIDVSTSKLTAIQSGASSLKVSGSTEVFNSESSGASNLKGYLLNSKTTSVLTTGASSARVFASEKLVANATGASSIKFKGDAKDVVAEASTASSITKIIDDNAGTSGANGENNEKRTKDKDGDSVVINLRAKRIVIFDRENNKSVKTKKVYDEEEFKHWAGLSLGVNGLLTPDATISMTPRNKYLDLNYGRSINVQLNLIQRNFNIYKNYVNLVTGFGVEWRRFMLDNKTNLNADSAFTWGVIDSTNTFNFRKNLFRSTMLQIPILVEFNTNKNPRKAFHIATGVVGQFLVGSRTKQRFERNRDEFEKERKDNYNQNPFVLKAHASVGYSHFTLFGEYSITSLFEKGKGPQLYPFVIGVRVVPFN